MDKQTEPLSNKLNYLLEKIHDSEISFKKAAEQTEHVFLKKYFEKKSIERYDFGNELKNEYILSGIQNESSNVTESNKNISGTVYRTWIDIKSFFSSNNNQSMLEVAIAGEKAALKDYKDILNQSSLTLRIRSILQKQKEAIENNLKTIKNLDDLK